MTKREKFEKILNVLLSILIGANIGIWIYRLEHEDGP